MSDTDQSLYNIRYNQVTQGMEGFGGGSPMWTPLTLVADGGINQLTGDVTAGPGAGNQVASISAATVTGKLLTGYVSGAGTISATDSILSAFNKLNGNVTAATLNTISRVASDPISPTEGTVWYNTTTHLLKYYDGAVIQTVAHV
jgi:hypothetical protein